MTKEAMILALELCIKNLKEAPMNEDTMILSCIDEMGYCEEPKEIVDFELGIEFDPEENFLMICSRFERKDF